MHFINVLVLCSYDPPAVHSHVHTYIHDTAYVTLIHKMLTKLLAITRQIVNCIEALRLVAVN